MTALTKYARLEASGLWRANPDDQRREVVVSVGDATLTITDLRDRALTHWSLAAVVRANPGARPAVYHPDGDPGETLELAEGEEQMTEAIETLCRAVARARPRPGRLRWLGLLLSLGAVVAVAVLWLPGALLTHTLKVVPHVKRAEIGTVLQDRIETLSGAACDQPGGLRALGLLRARLGVGPLHVMPDAIGTTLHLPGGTILLDRALVEDFEAPDVAAGFVVAEEAALRARDPLAGLLEAAGIRASFQLLTTGTLDDAVLDAYAQTLLTGTRGALPPDQLLPAFAAAGVPSTPYAYARDISGETVLPLIEGDPVAARSPQPLLGDADWLRLQGICGG